VQEDFCRWMSESDFWSSFVKVTLANNDRDRRIHVCDFRLKLLRILSKSSQEKEIDLICCYDEDYEEIFQVEAFRQAHFCSGVKGLKKGNSQVSVDGQAWSRAAPAAPRNVHPLSLEVGSSHATSLFCSHVNSFEAVIGCE